jgi:predicted metalloprotease with PDZ domain
VGWLLDARIRRSTGNAGSLDGVMRRAFESYSGERGFTTEQFKALVGNDEFFRRTVETTEELDYAEALEWFGLRFKAQEAASNGGTLGCEARIEDGRLIVKRVPRGTPAWQAGLSAEDEIIAIDDFRVRPDQLSKRLEEYLSGDKISVLIARRDVLMRLDLTLGDEPKRWQLEIAPDAADAQKQNLARWFGL